MAITKCLYINTSNQTGATKKAVHLKNSLGYIIDEEKTSKENFNDIHMAELTKYIKQDYKIAHNETHYVSSVNCTVTNAYNEMKKTKEHFGKTGGRMGYHYIISFKPNEIDNETAWKITNDFVKQFLNDEYECVYALHTDKSHIHSHIVFNSVNYKTGKKFHSPFGDWENRIQPLVNQLCIENNVPPLDYHIDEYMDENGKKVIHYEYSKNFNFKNKIKADIDEAISQSDTFEEFCKYLQVEKKYRIKQGKYMALALPDMIKFRRLKESTVGIEYTTEMIKERIAFKNGDYDFPKLNMIPTVCKVYIKGAKNHKKYRDMNYVEKACIRRMLRMRKLTQHIGYSNSYIQAQQKKKLSQSIANYKFVYQNNIQTKDDVKALLKIFQAEKSKLFSEYKKNNYRKKFSNEVMEMYEQLNNLQLYYDLYVNYNDNDYIDDYKRYNEILDTLQQKGVNPVEITNYINIVNDYSSSLKKQLNELNAKINICKRLLNNSSTEITRNTTKNEITKNNINNKQTNKSTNESISPIDLKQTKKSTYENIIPIDPNEANITINQGLIIKEDNNYFYTRIPKLGYKKGKVLRIPKEELKIIDDEKTILYRINLQESYEIFAFSDDKIMDDSDHTEVIDGVVLYNYYDEVERTVVKKNPVTEQKH